jgi:hypothetical protein
MASFRPQAGDDSMRVACFIYSPNISTGAGAGDEVTVIPLWA